MRINLFGGPGIGKSTLALYLCSELKKLNYNIEYVGEWIKQWAHEKKTLLPWDQFHAFSQQIYAETSKLNNNVNLIISDSPVLMNIAYMRRDKSPYVNQCLDLYKVYSSQYPDINIRLLRGSIGYHKVGRWESEQEAVEMDLFIKSLMDEVLPEYVELHPIQNQDILYHILKRLQRNKVFDILDLKKDQ
jgi:hypothetical protein